MKSSARIRELSARFALDRASLAILPICLRTQGDAFSQVAAQSGRACTT